MGDPVLIYHPYEPTARVVTRPTVPSEDPISQDEALMLAMQVRIDELTEQLDYSEKGVAEWRADALELVGHLRRVMAMNELYDDLAYKCLLKIDGYKIIDIDDSGGGDYYTKEVKDDPPK